ncbi:uncharacterized protein N7469_005559 [Penicillium citrinum]|uniref:Rhodopsin domain-containing protein n=1 Tax=Penicillium citrinum TaxID=5077 RepID=A0A9W9P1T2_PENCI|nr:uncharacterized protein N7469_005559 [Penicillium citrinum]KAJ5233793.1 hypothetical protein N7469_005559 [Penicillium citrinum]
MSSLQYEDLHLDDISWRIWVGTLTTIIPATIVVVLRFVARYVSRAGLWWDDYTIVISLVLNWAMDALRWAQVLQFGLGKHNYQITDATFQSFGKTFIGSQVIYFTTAVFTKVSLLLLYYRIFGVVRTFRWALWISFGLVISYFISCTIVSIVSCSPVPKFWDPSLPGYCIDEVAFFRWNGFANMALDILVLCLPYPMAWRLQTSIRQKFILTGIFLLGGFSVCVVSVLRIVSFDFVTLEDVTYVSVTPSTWSSIEQSVGVICACLPTLRPLVRRLYGASSNTPEWRSGSTPNSSQRSSFPLRNSCADEENSPGIAVPSCPQEVRKSEPQCSDPQPSAPGEGQSIDEGKSQALRPVSFA